MAAAFAPRRGCPSVINLHSYVYLNGHKDLAGKARPGEGVGGFVPPIRLRARGICLMVGKPAPALWYAISFNKAVC